MCEEAGTKRTGTARLALAAFVAGALLAVLPALFGWGVSVAGSVAAAYCAGMLPFVAAFVLGLRSRATMMGRYVAYASVIVAFMITLNLAVYFWVSGLDVGMPIVP